MAACTVQGLATCMLRVPGGFSSFAAVVFNQHRDLHRGLLVRGCMNYACVCQQPCEPRQVTGPGNDGMEAGEAPSKARCCSLQYFQSLVSLCIPALVSPSNIAKGWGLPRVGCTPLRCRAALPKAQPWAWRGVGKAVDFFSDRQRVFMGFGKAEHCAGIALEQGTRSLQAAVMSWHL